MIFTKSDQVQNASYVIVNVLVKFKKINTLAET